MALIEEKLGADAFKGDGVAMLQAIYKNPNFPAEMRMEAATRAARYERHALTAVDATVREPTRYVVRVPVACKTTEEWLEQHARPLDALSNPVQPDKPAEPALTPLWLSKAG